MLKVDALGYEAGRADVFDPALHGLVAKVVGHPSLYLAGLHRLEDAFGEFHPSLGARVQYESFRWIT